MLFSRRNSPFLALALGLLLSACGDQEARANSPQRARAPEHVEPHPLALIEQALEDPSTPAERFWELGISVFGWSPAGPSELESVAASDLKAWILEDLQWASVGDWPYEIRRPLARGTAPSSGLRGTLGPELVLRDTSPVSPHFGSSPLSS